MRILRFIPLITLGFASCEAEVTVPEDVVPQEQFVEVMIDMQLLEAAFNMKHLGNKEADTIMYPRYREVYAHHGISPETFRYSYDWYLSEPELMDEVYEEVLNKLSIMEEEVKNAPDDAEEEAKEERPDDRSRERERERNRPRSPQRPSRE